MVNKIPTGWQCPVCGTVHAPHINTCPGHAKSQGSAKPGASNAAIEQLRALYETDREQRERVSPTTVPFPGFTWQVPGGFGRHNFGV